jgi:hypothetical protein
MPKPDHLDSGLVNVVLEAHKSAFSVQSDFARREAEFVAMAASLGLISTRVHKDIFSRHWRPTVKGLTFLESLHIDDTLEEDYDDIQLDYSLSDS